MREKRAGKSEIDRHRENTRVRKSDTGWQKPIGCLKLQVSFHKKATDYRALLQKMTYKDKASYRSSPPCKKTCMLDQHANMHTHTYVCVNERGCGKWVAVSYSTCCSVLQCVAVGGPPAKSRKSRGENELLESIREGMPLLTLI